MKQITARQKEILITFLKRSRFIIQAVLFVIAFAFIFPQTTLAASQLNGGGILHTNENITSPDGHYILNMQSDGNAIVLAWPRPLWATGTNIANSTLEMQTDGNLVVYAPGHIAKWSSGTYSPGAFLVLQNDANLVIVSAGGQAIWASGSVNTRIDAGQILQPNWYIQSPDRRYRMLLQTDGNLVEYLGNQAVWASGTYQANSTLEMQSDGNMVIYAPGHVAVWASNTNVSNSALVGQNDGNFVIYAPGNVAVWGTQTSSSTSTAQLAQQVLSNGNIALTGRCVSDDVTRASQGRPGTSGAYLSGRMLSNLLNLANTQKIVVTAIESCGTGHASGSSHYRGTAADLVPGAGNSLGNIARTIYNNRGGWYIDELIFDPMPSGTTTLKGGNAFTYDASTRSAHRDHVHYSVK